MLKSVKTKKDLQKCLQTENFIYLCAIKQHTQTPHTMTTTTNQQVINLINRALDAHGYLIKAKSRKNQMEAKQLLESGIDFYGELVNGFHTHNCLLIIAYPNKSL
jgi:hypothetical protein